MASTIAAIPDEVDRLVHLGDFGLMGSGFDTFLYKVNRAAAARGVDVRVVPGNHENYDWIARQPTDGDGLIAADWIRLFPRGYRFTVEGVTFCAVGGAVSVDQGRRTPGKSRWPAEAARQVGQRLGIRPREVERCIDAWWQWPSRCGAPEPARDPEVIEGPAVIDTRAATVVRMRVREQEQLQLLDIRACTAGHPMVLLLDVRQDGIATTRQSTRLAGRHVTGYVSGTGGAVVAAGDVCECPPGCVQPCVAVKLGPGRSRSNGRLLLGGSRGAPRCGTRYIRRAERASRSDL